MLTQAEFGLIHAAVNDLAAASETPRKVPWLKRLTCRQTWPLVPGSRYLGSLVADYHRNLFKGSSCPELPTAKKRHGKLRLLCGATPWPASSGRPGANS